MRRRSAVEEVLEHRLMRLVLAVLIVVSVLPFDALEKQLRPFFLVVFGLELIVRLGLIATRRVSPTRLDWAFIAFDVIALISFLPLEAMMGRDTTWLRAFRLVRLLVLIRFTQALARDVWTVLTRREQIQQLALITLGVLSLSFVGAVVLAHLGVGHDYDRDGHPDAESFWDQIWWTFQQVEDPGNLVASVRTDPVALVVSLLLTIFGIFIFSYLIGVGTNVVEQVLRAERRRPIGYRDHMLVIGPVHESELLVSEFVRIYEKNAVLRRIGPKQIWGWLFKGHGRPRRHAVPKIALVGKNEEPPSFLYEQGMRRVVYRTGEGADPDTLDRVNVDEAKRVVLIAPNGPDDEADAITIARLAAIRARNRSAHVFVEVKQSRNEELVAEIGGAGTFPLDSTRFLGLFLCQHLIVPGVETLLDELLSARGDEMYTHLFVDDWERSQLERLDEIQFADLAAHAHREHGVTLLGSFVGAPLKRNAMALVPADRVKPWVNPLVAGRDRRMKRAGALHGESFRGFFGIAETYVPMRSLSQDVLTDRVRANRPNAAEALLRRVVLSELRPPKRVLVVGNSPALAPMIKALAHFVPEVEVRVVLDGDTDSARRAAEALGVELDEGAKVLERNGRLRVFHEPMDLATAAVQHVPPRGLDAAVFLSSSDALDVDASTTLRVLHFVQSAAAGRFRLLVELEEAHRGEQLARQLGRMKLALDLTILSSNQIKNYFMVHSAFVPGLTEVYARLLGTRGQEIVRLPLREETSGKPVRFDAIREALTSRGCIPLALQVSGEIVLNPSHDARFASSDLQAIYALACSDRLRERFPEHPSLPPPTD